MNYVCVKMLAQQENLALRFRLFGTMMVGLLSSVVGDDGSITIFISEDGGTVVARGC